MTRYRTRDRNVFGDGPPAALGVSQIVTDTPVSITEIYKGKTLLQYFDKNYLFEKRGARCAMQVPDYPNFETFGMAAGGAVPGRTSQRLAGIGHDRPVAFRRPLRTFMCVRANEFRK